MLWIQDSRVKSEEQANPRSRVVLRVPSVSPTEYIWRMSQWCLSLAGPWRTEVVGHQLIQFHTHSAKLPQYTNIPDNRRSTPSQSYSASIFSSQSYKGKVNGFQPRGPNQVQSPCPKGTRAWSIDPRYLIDFKLDIWVHQKCLFQSPPTLGRPHQVMPHHNTVRDGCRVRYGTQSTQVASATHFMPLFLLLL